MKDNTGVEILHGIFHVVNQRKFDNVSLSHGTSGRIIFLFEYYRVFPNSHALFAFNIQLTSTLRNIQSCDMITYSDGLCGVGASLQYLLVQDERLSPYLLPVLYDIDELARRYIQTYCSKGDYDFLHGSTGICSYLFERKNSEGCSHFVENLHELKLENIGRDATWMLPSIQVQDDNPIINVSLSHGITSIAMILCKLSLWADFKHRRLADSLLNYILSFLINIEDKNGLIRFPNSVSVKKELDFPYSSRLAWCYGDLGIGITLLRIAHLKGNHELLKSGIDILESTVLRKLKDPLTGVEDATLCHGSAGISQIYYRAYQLTKRKMFKDASLYWSSVTLELYKNENVYYSYRMILGSEDDNIDDTFGFLYGITGIGLNLLTLKSKRVGPWDRLLLINY